MSPWQSRRSGFTLVELLVVVLIIGILAAIALPRFLGQRTRSKNAAAQAAVRHALVAARSYYTQQGESYVGLGPSELRGYESSLSGTEPADNARPGDSGVSPQDIWIGNGLSGTNPNTTGAGDPNGGTTVTLCSVSRGDTVYCIKDVNGVASYTQATSTGVSSSSLGTYAASWSSGGSSSAPTYNYASFSSGASLSASSGSGNCGLLSDATLRCWGANSYSQLGDGTTTSSSVPVVATVISGVAAVTNTNSSTCVLLQSDGSARCWGNNNYGQLGNGSTTNSSTPVAPAGTSGGTAIYAGTWNVCVMFSGGTAKCWGYNYGNLGDGTSTQRTSPVAVTGLSGASSLALGDNMSCALISAAVRCWGDNGYGQLGVGNNTAVWTASGSSAISSGVTQVVAGGYFVCALLSGATVSCWGHNAYGQIGDGGTTNRSSPTAVPGLSGVTQLSSGYHHTCALINDGSVKCWGRNQYGQLGNSGLGVGGQSTSPVTVSGVSGPGSLFSTQFGTCARWSSGTVKCWGGSPANGQSSDSAAAATLSGT